MEEKDMKVQAGRRNVLKGAAAIAGTAAIGAPGLLLAQSQPIRIGICNALSGPNAPFGENNLAGHKIAVNQVNRAGGIMGRQVELVVRDDKAQAAQGATISREFAGSGINLMMGSGSSAVAIAMCPLAQELKMVFVVNSAAAMGITHEAWNRNVFRLCPNAYTLFRANGRAVAEKYPNVLKWSAITPDYSFGHDAAKTFGNAVKQYHAKRDSKDFEVANTIVVGATQSDFRPQINSLMNSNVEGLFIGLQGGNEISFFQQARAVGLDKKLKVMSETGGDVVFITLGKDMPDAVWTNVFWPYTLEPVKSNKQSQQLLTEAIAMTGSKFPNSHVYKGYHAMQGLLEGIKKAKSADTDAVINAMEDMTWESPTGPVKVRKEDHAAMGVFFPGVYVPDTVEPYCKLREVIAVNESTAIEPPSPGKEFVMG
jgi:branched-chain amino acid transport system substrate-binding protein